MPSYFRQDLRAARRPGPRSVLAGLVLALVAIAAGAHSAVDPAHITSGHPTGHVGDREGIPWPPEPRGLRDAVVFSDPAEETRAREAQRRRADRDEVAALRSGELRRALGSRYVRTDEGRFDAKGGEAPVRRLVYFSYARNATVEVEVDDTGLREFRVIDPAEYQPEITDAEIEQAAGIARSYFLQAGKSRVTDLQAFGILAYRPEGRGFFSTRVLYISFHADSDSPPQFAAWVDLTAGQVLRSREERQ